MSQNLSAITEPTPPSSNDWRAKGEESQFKRDEEQKDAWNFALVWSVRIAVCLFLCVLAIRSFHMIAPQEWKWLEEKDLQEIDKIIFSGAIGGFIGGYLKKNSEK